MKAWAYLIEIAAAYLLLAAFMLWAYRAARRRKHPDGDMHQGEGT